MLHHSSKPRARSTTQLQADTHLVGVGAMQRRVQAAGRQAISNKTACNTEGTAGRGRSRKRDRTTAK